MRYLVVLFTFSLTLVDSKLQSNVSTEIVQGRVIGGSPAENIDYLYAVKLRIITKKGVAHCCGSIIHEDFILTAAFCLSGEVPVEVYFSRIIDDGQNFFIANPEDFIIHEGYKGWDKGTPNIGLIKRKGDPFGIEPINLLSKIISDVPIYTKKEAFVMGWGKTITAKGSGFSKTLQWGKVLVLEKEDCKRLVPLTYESLICTKSRNSQAAYLGDEGGPLVFESEDGKRIQIGVITNIEAENPKNPLQIPKYNFATSVALFYEWISKQIIYGNNACKLDLTYAVKLYSKDKHTNKIECAGSVISAYYILTAAHCLNGMIRVQVFFGSNSDLDAKFFYAEKEDIIIHPKFYRSARYDIGLVERKTHALLVQPIKLLSEIDSDVPIYIGKKALVMGWGRKSQINDVAPNILQWEEVNVVETDTCREILSTSYKSHICTESRQLQSVDDGDSTYHGDAGGPLVYKLEDDTYVQIGVISKTIAVDSKVKSIKTKYSNIGINVTYFYDWINEIVKLDRSKIKKKKWWKKLG